MKYKRIICSAIIISLIFSVIPLFGAYAEETEPTIEIIGSTIKRDNKFFELGMEITAGSEGFFSAGIALEYDSSVITPVAWDGEDINMSDRTDWQNVAALPAISPKGISGRTALAYQKDGKGYLSLTGEAPLPVKTLADKRVITVRFKYEGGDDTARAVNKQRVIDGFAEGKIVSLSDDIISADSPVGQMVLYRAGGDAETEYYYTSVETTQGIMTEKKLSAPPVFKLKENEDSADSGGSDASKFAALVFFDWDESTLLGSMVVDSAMPEEEIKETINTYTQTLMPPDADMSNWSDTAAKAYTTYDTKYPLASHDGYSFGKWIDFNSEDFTVYGEAVKATDAGVMETIPTPEDPDFNNLSGGLILKAAYVSNTKMDSLTTAVKREYTISNDSAPEKGYYGRYGTSNNYSLKFKVTRENTDKQPVQRTRTTALRVIYNITGDTQIYSLVSMENLDEQIVEIAAPANAESVDVSVIDIGGTADWATGSADRSTKFPVNSKQSGDDYGYIIYGTVNYINQQVAEENITTLGADIFNSAGLNVSAGNVFGATSSGVIVLRRQAVTNIRTGQQQKITAEGITYLSPKEMQNAITYGDYRISS